MTEEYDKLVRDGVPDVVEADGETPITHTADDAEFEERLVEKLEEEVAEYRESREVPELVDVMEVVHAIRDHEGVPFQRLEAMRAQKAAERGGFTDRIVLERVE